MVELQIVLMSVKYAAQVEELVRSKNLARVRVQSPKRVARFLTSSAVEYLPTAVAVNSERSVRAVLIGIPDGSGPAAVIRSAVSNNGNSPALIELFPGGTKARPTRGSPVGGLK